MPVHVSPAIQGQPTKTYVACDRRDDMGRIPIASPLLQQWQMTASQVAFWIVRGLNLRGKPKKDKKTGTIQMGMVQGKKNSSLLVLGSGPPVSLIASGKSLPLRELVYIEHDQLTLDSAAIFQMVDRPILSSSKTRHKPSVIKREDRKLKTLEMYKSWRKEYFKLKRKRGGMSDLWYSLQIAEMGISQGRDSETIRKNMKQY